MIKKLRVLSISFDSSILDKNSDSFKRQAYYASLCNSYVIIIFSIKYFQPIRSGNLHVFSTNSITKFTYILDTLRLLKRIYETQQFDLITVQDPFVIGLAGVLIKFIYKLPLNVQIHSEFFNSADFRHENWQNFIFYFLGLSVLKFADTVRARNNKIKHDIEIRFPKLRNKIFYCGSTINKIYLAPIFNFKRDKNLIVSVGRLVKQKNFILLFEAFKQVLLRRSNAKLMIIGEGPLKLDLVKVVEELGISKSVSFAGSKTPEEIKRIFDTAGLYVLSSNHEGWALVCLEALARGLPVVMTDTGCAGEIVVNTQTGYVVPVGDREKLVSHILYSLRYLSESVIMAKKGRKKVLADCNLKTIGTETLNMFQATAKSYEK